MNANIEELSGWKQEKPTAPGAYWQKGHMLDEPELVRLLRIEVMDGELCVVDNEDAGDHRATLTDWRNDFFWIGPLTEQAEAFKGELQAYDGMVRELTKTVEDMRAAQFVPVVGEPVAYLNECLLKLSHPVMPYVSINEPVPDKDWCITPLYKVPAHSSPAAELATLREKAAETDSAQEEKAKFAFKAARLKQERDELRKDADDYAAENMRMREALKHCNKILSDSPRTHNVAIVLELLRTAIAQGKGE